MTAIESARQTLLILLPEILILLSFDLHDDRRGVRQGASPAPGRLASAVALVVALAGARRSLLDEAYGSRPLWLGRSQRRDVWLWSGSSFLLTGLLILAMAL